MEDADQEHPEVEAANLRRLKALAPYFVDK